MSDAGEILTARVQPMRSSAKAHGIIKQFEGLFLSAYLCPAGVWTIGWGHTAGVKKGDRISLDTAERMFRDDIREFDEGVSSLLVREVPQHVFDALVSFGFNVGLDIDEDVVPEGLGDSTLLRLVNQGNMEAAANEFKFWVKGGRPRKVMPGLVKRRRMERALFEGLA